MLKIKEINSLKCLNVSSIHLLNKNKLLLPLVKAELTRDILSKIEVSEVKSDSLLKNLKEKIGITNEDSYQAWIKNNSIIQEDFENSEITKYQLKKYINERFDHKVESYFLERKNNLDTVTYSIIRSRNNYLVLELFHRISDDAEDFGKLATTYSEGLEKNTNGLIGPVPLSSAHPKLVGILESSKIGEINQPFRIGDSNIIVRLESYTRAKLDETMRTTLGEELFDKWISSQALELSKTMLKKSMNN